MGGKTEPAPLDHLRAVRQSISSKHTCVNRCPFCSVTAAFRALLADLADDPTPPFPTSLYEYVKVDTFYAVAPLPEITQESHWFPNATGLTNAVILGSIQTYRRDYLGVMADLERSLEGVLPFARYTW